MQTCQKIIFCASLFGAFACDDSDDAPLTDGSIDAETAADAASQTDAAPLKDAASESDATVEDAAVSDAASESDATVAEDASASDATVSDAASESDATAEDAADAAAEDATAEEDAACPERSFGADCEPCSCAHGVCKNGPEGDGKCSECTGDFAGENCDRPITCEHGTPNSGVLGDGKCIDCDKGFAGPNCDHCAGGFEGDDCTVCEKGYGPDCRLYGWVPDPQGHLYRTVEIGDQTWMAENYRRPVGEFHIDANAYGLYYSYETATADGFCPEGWHLPSRSEFESLISYVSDHRTSESNFLSLISNSPLWESVTGEMKDEFGFGAFPESYYDPVIFGESGFYSFGRGAQFWSQSDQYALELSAYGSSVTLGNYTSASTKMTVRCIKD